MPVPAVRLIAVQRDSGTTGGTRGGPMVGRARELGRLRKAFAQVVEEAHPIVVTVLGDAGAGKSRLVAEFLDGVAAHANVMRGRCLPYGDGATYWPLRGLLHQAAGISEADTPEDAMARLRGLNASSVDGKVLAARLGSAIGLSTQPASTDEIFWAVRRTFEAIASARPLVLVFEDLHWAEATLLDLIKHLSDGAAAPILLLCTARRELLEVEPTWAKARAGRTLILLRGLPAEAAASLADSIAGQARIDPELRSRIIATAEGNPLFVEEMVRVALESPPGASRSEAAPRAGASVSVPPTISAVMAARLDQLPNPERTVAQRGSVVGRVFEEPAIASMSPERSAEDIQQSLGELVRKELVTPDSSELSSGRAFKFRHILIRDAAYEGLPKSERAELHEESATWLEAAAGQRLAEYREILAYHLLEAHRYRTELRETSRRTLELARRAIAHLGEAARRARERGDGRAAVGLLSRAVELPPPDPAVMAELHLELGLVLLEVGEVNGARQHAQVALEGGASIDDARILARARLLKLDVSIADGSLVDADAAAATEVALALEDAQRSGDALALAAAWRTKGGQAYMLGRSEEALRWYITAIDYARASGNDMALMEQEGELLTLALVGSTAARDVADLAGSMLGRAGGYPYLRAHALRVLAIAEAMLGRADEARAHVDEAVSIVRDLGLATDARVSFLADQGWVRALVGDGPMAEEAFREAYAEAKSSGDRTGRSWAACRVLQFLKDQGRLQEAEAFLDESDRVPMVMNRTRVLGGRVRLLAASGHPRARRELARLLRMLEGVRASSNIVTDGFVDAAEAAATLGDGPSAKRYAEEALRFAEAKGNVARAAQIRLVIDRIAAYAAESGASMGSAG